MLAARARPARIALLLALGLLHLGLLLVLLRPGTTPRSRERQVLTLWALLPEAPSRIEARPHTRAQRRSTASGRAITTSIKPPASPEAGAATLEAASIAAASPAADAASAPTPLNLQLPRDALRALEKARNPATSDPRSNRMPLSLEERMALAIRGQDFCMLDELQPDGSVRRFEGHRVGEASATGSADPFGRSFSTGGGPEGGTGGAGSAIRHSVCVKK